MLAVENLTVAYGLHQALHGVSITAWPGEIVAILGANGAGKSSLLRALAGVSAGKVGGSARLGERSLLGLKPHEVVAGGVAFVPEGRGIFGDLSVWENLQLGAYAPRAAVKREARLGEVLALFPKLSERRRQIARTMSGGEQQMVAVGRAIMSAPEILMLDEPSLGLSPLVCKELFATLSRIRDSGVGVLLVEQNARRALEIADRAYLLENGAITGEGAARDLLADPAVRRAYLGEAAAT